MVFIDESGFMLQPLVRRTWAEQGKTPLLEQWDRHDRLSVLTALVLSPQRKHVRQFFQILDHNAKTEDFLWFLERLHQEVGRKLWVVWDNLGAHRRAENMIRKSDCDWFHFERLPPYAPELNPVEHVWTTTKWGHLANAPPEDVDQLHGNVDQALTSQANQQRLLKSHFLWAKLKLD